MLRAFSRALRYQSEEALLDKLNSISTLENLQPSRTLALISELAEYSSSANQASLAKIRTHVGLGRVLASLPHNCEAFAVHDITSLVTLRIKVGFPTDYSLRRVIPALARLLRDSDISDVLHLAALISDERLLSKSLWETIINRVESVDHIEWVVLTNLKLSSLVQHKAQFPVRLLNAILPVLAMNVVSMTEAQLLDLLKVLSRWPSSLKVQKGGMSLVNSLIKELSKFGPLPLDGMTSISVLARNLPRNLIETSILRTMPIADFNTQRGGLQPKHLLDSVLARGKIEYTTGCENLLTIGSELTFPESVSADDLVRTIHHARSFTSGNESLAIFFKHVEPSILRGMRRISSRYIALLIKNMCVLGVGSQEIWASSLSRLKTILNHRGDISVIDVAATFSALCEMSVLSSDMVSKFETVILESIHNLSFTSAIDSLWALAVMRRLGDSPLADALLPIITSATYCIDANYSRKLNDVLMELKVNRPTLENDVIIQTVANSSIPAISFSDASHDASDKYNIARRNLRASFHDINLFGSDPMCLYKIGHHYVEVAAKDFSSALVVLDKDIDYTHLGQIRGTTTLKISQISRYFEKVFVILLTDCYTVESTKMSLKVASQRLAPEFPSQKRTLSARTPGKDVDQQSTLRSQTPWAQVNHRGKHAPAILPWQSNEVFKLQKQRI